MSNNTVQTTGVKGEIRSDLHRSVRMWMIDNSATWDTVVAEAMEEWAAKRSVEKDYPSKRK